MEHTSLVIALVSVTALAGVTWALWTRSKKARSSQQVSIEEPQRSLSPSRVRRLDVGNADRPAISIVRLPEDLGGALEPVRVDSKTLSRLSPLLASAPSLATNVATASTTAYRLTFAPEVMQSLNDGSLALKKSLEGGVRAMAEGNAGNVVAHGSLHSLDVLSAAAAAAAAWQILSIAVGQKHLADISAKLQTISDGVRSIRDWLHNDQQGRLTGNLEYLQTIASCYLDGTLAEADLKLYRTHLEDVERESLQLQRSIEREMVQFEQAVAAVPLDEWGTRRDTQTLQAKVSEFQQLGDKWLLALNVRGAACQLSCALPGDQPVARRRLAAIQSVVEDGPPWAGAGRVIESLAATKLKSIWNKEETLQVRRRSILESLRMVNNGLASRQAQVAEGAKRASELLVLEDQTLANGLTLAVTLDAQGSIVEVARIRDAQR